MDGTAAFASTDPALAAVPAHQASPKLISLLNGDLPSQSAPAAREAGEAGARAGPNSVVLLDSRLELPMPLSSPGVDAPANDGGALPQGAAAQLGPEAQCQQPINPATPGTSLEGTLEHPSPDRSPSVPTSEERAREDERPASAGPAPAAAPHPREDDKHPSSADETHQELVGGGTAPAPAATHAAPSAPDTTIVVSSIEAVHSLVGGSACPDGDDDAFAFDASSGVELHLGRPEEPDEVRRRHLESECALAHAPALPDGSLAAAVCGTTPTLVDMQAGTVALEEHRARQRGQEERDGGGGGGAADDRSGHEHAPGGGAPPAGADGGGKQPPQPNDDKDGGEGADTQRHEVRCINPAHRSAASLEAGGRTWFCTKCRPAPALEEEKAYELVGDPGLKNGEKKLRARILRTPEWESHDTRTALADELDAASPDPGSSDARLARALRKKDVPSLRKAHLLALARRWGIASDIWLKKGEATRRRSVAAKKRVRGPKAKGRGAKGTAMPGNASGGAAAALPFASMGAIGQATAQGAGPSARGFEDYSPRAQDGSGARPRRNAVSAKRRRGPYGDDFEYGAVAMGAKPPPGAKRARVTSRAGKARAGGAGRGAVANIGNMMAPPAGPFYAAHSPVFSWDVMLMSGSADPPAPSLRAVGGGGGTLGATGGSNTAGIPAEGMVGLDMQFYHNAPAGIPGQLSPALSFPVGNMMPPALPMGTLPPNPSSHQSHLEQPTAPRGGTYPPPAQIDDNVVFAPTPHAAATGVDTSSAPLSSAAWLNTEIWTDILQGGLPAGRGL